MSVLDSVNIFMPDVTKAMVDFYIDALPDGVVSCLSAYTKAQSDQAKALYVMHSVTLSSGGQVTQERSPTGASISFAAETGKGSASTSYGKQLAGLAAGKCLLPLLSSGEQFAYSVGRKC